MPPVAAAAEESFLPEHRAPSCDWRCASDYAYAAELTNAELAWEFLRRCPEYRADAHRWFGLQIRAKARRPTAGAVLAHEADALSDRLCEKWQLLPLEGLRCPDGELPPVFEDALPWRALRTGRVWVDGKLVSPGFGVQDEPRSSAAEVRIDLDRPVEPQIEEIRRFIGRLEEQYRIQVPLEPTKDVRRSRNDQLYLRILDALLEGASQAEMEPVLYDVGHARAPRAIYDDAKRAQQIARRGYMDLLLRKVRK